jgi:HEAT repeat protein
MDPAAVRLLEDDIRSGQPERQAPAARVLGALGELGVPLLIDVIKRENDFRVRQLAAQLIADAGSAGPEQIKRSLATEVIVEQRARLLDVIDTVTSDLRNELQQCFYDPAPRVRRAAYELFERLQRDDLIDLIVPFARQGQPAAARATIRALARHATPTAVEALSSILDTTRDSRVAALCCQALGRSEHPAAIDALARTLTARRFKFFGHRWSRDVRSTAAAALRQIPHPRAAAALARFAYYVNRKGPRIVATQRLPDASADAEDASEAAEAKES